MRITFPGHANRTETLTNFPALVVLSNNMASGFTFNNFISTNGWDFRFVTNLISTNYLNYEIEAWNTHWARFIDFGNTSASDNIFFSRNGTTSPLTFEVHSNTTAGAQVSATGALVPRNVTRVQNYVGHSAWAADSYYGGLMDELRVESVPARRAPAGIVQQQAKAAVEPEHDLRAFPLHPHEHDLHGFAVPGRSRFAPVGVIRPGLHSQHRHAFSGRHALLPLQESRAPVMGVDGLRFVKHRQPDAPEAARPRPVPPLLHGAKLIGHHQMHRRTLVAFAAGHGHEARPVEGRATTGRVNLPNGQVWNAAGVEHIRHL